MSSAYDVFVTLCARRLMWRMTVMNFRWKKYADFPQVLLAFLLSLILFAGWVAILSMVPPDSADQQTRASNTRTAIALTSQALLGPFPTSTGPTPTLRFTPSVTLTPSATRTPLETSSPTLYVF